MCTADMSRVGIVLTPKVRPSSTSSWPTLVKLIVRSFLPTITLNGSLVSLKAKKLCLAPLVTATSRTIPVSSSLLSLSLMSSSSSTSTWATRTQPAACCSISAITVYLCTRSIGVTLSSAMHIARLTDPAATAKERASCGSPLDPRRILSSDWKKSACLSLPTSTWAISTSTSKKQRRSPAFRPNQAAKSPLVCSVGSECVFRLFGAHTIRLRHVRG